MTRLILNVDAEIAERAEELARAAGTTVSGIFSRLVNSAGTAASQQPQQEAESLDDMIAAIRAEVPDEEWDRVPADIIENLDHYVYGTRKK